MVPTGLTLVTTSPPALPQPGIDESRPRLGEILCARGLISTAQVDECLARQRRMDVRLGELLRYHTGLDSGALQQAIEHQWESGPLDLDAFPPDPTLILQVGLSECFEMRAMPWRRIGGATVIAAVHPDQFLAMKADYETLFGPVMLAVVSEEELTSCLSRLFPDALNTRAETRLAPSESCRSWRSDRFQRISAGVFVGLSASLFWAPIATLLGLLSLALVVLVASLLLKVAALWALLRDRPVSVPGNVLTLHPTVETRLPVVSLLVPLFQEEQIAERLVRQLRRIKYPEALLDVCLVVEDDDPVTQRTLARTDLPDWMRVLRAPHGTLRTKPRALNYALDFCRGSIVGVYDAEDSPDPDQIALVVTRFAQAHGNVACLQGRLAFYNSAQNWFSRCFAIEYATWFGVVLPGIARLGLAVPLGGTTLFFRTHILRDLGGWDAFNVTEDADLGIRLTRHGYRTELIDTETREEANCHGWAWVRQRSRWIKGYAMTYATHMQHPVQLWRDLGPRAFFGFQVMFLGSLLQALLAPALWTGWLFLLAIPHPAEEIVQTPTMMAIVSILVISGILNFTLSALALQRSGQIRLLPWAIVMNIYHMMATLAAYKALIELMFRPFFWDKTAHGLSPTGVDET